MDENNNWDKQNNEQQQHIEQPQEQQVEQQEQRNTINPFQTKTFYIAYLATITLLLATSWLLERSDFWFVAVLMLSIPYAMIGSILWAITKRKNRPVALGILFGSLTPLMIAFVFTGGCFLRIF